MRDLECQCTILNVETSLRRMSVSPYQSNTACKMCDGMVATIWKAPVLFDWVWTAPSDLTSEPIYGSLKRILNRKTPITRRGPKKQESWRFLAFGPHISLFPAAPLPVQQWIWSADGRLRFILFSNVLLAGLSTFCHYYTLLTWRHLCSSIFGVSRIGP